MRRLVAGNWKMNGSRAMLAEIDAIAAAARAACGVEVALCPPFTLIAAAAAQAGDAVAIGGQDCHRNRAGAHTGHVAATMLAEAGATLAIVGHSERRADDGETDGDVRAKAEAAIAAGLRAIVCVGETEAERDAGRAEAVVAAQLAGSLPEGADAGMLAIAYEPVWAIGTGRNASCEDVAAMHGHLRGLLVERLGAAGADVPILYGGSVKPDNAAALFATAEVGGALVGGASLTAAQFVPIIRAAADAD